MIFTHVLVSMQRRYQLGGGGASAVALVLFRDFQRGDSEQLIRLVTIVTSSDSFLPS